MVNHKMSSKLLPMVMSVTWCSFAWANTDLRGPYLGQTPPGVEPQVFAPGVISMPNRSEWTGSFTPDGQEFYYTITNPSWSVNRVMVTSQTDGVWSTPTAASFSGQYIDWTVFLSPDGQRVFFSSSRPTNHWLTFNVWMCERQGSAWSEPVKLPMNFPGIDYAGTCTESGTLYFASERSGSIGIFRSVPLAGEYTGVERLPSYINAGHSEQCPWIAPDEGYLIFASSREGNRDLYISYRTEGGFWTEPVSLGPSINTWDDEWNPTVSPDGKYLFYGRGRSIDGTNEHLDLYWVETRAFLSDAGTSLPDPNGPIQNLSSGERFPSIQRAITYVAAGDILVLEPGVYQEAITIDKNVVLQSVDPDNPMYIGGTIIQGDMNEPVLTFEGCTRICEIAGLTLRAGSVGVQGKATDATIRNCRIMDNLTHGMELFQLSSPHLLGCLITANGQAGIKLHSIPGGRLPLNCEPIIENCYIMDNSETGVIGDKPVIIDSLIQGQ